MALGAVLNLLIDLAGMAPALNRFWNAEDATELVDAVSFVFDRVLGHRSRSGPNVSRPVG